MPIVWAPHGREYCERDFCQCEVGGIWECTMLYLSCYFCTVVLLKKDVQLYLFVGEHGKKKQNPH